MSTFQKLLVKSKYINGLQCPKLLWIAINQKERIPEINELDQVRFDEGNLVGNEAKKLYPDGIDISTEDFKNNLEDSILLLKKGKPLFEAAFIPQNTRIYSRADILEPTKEGWNIIEVKSSTKVKAEHIQDVSFQKYCCEQAGLKINKCFVMHLNSKYVRKGKINLKELFIKEDITKKLEPPKRIKEMLEIIDGKEPKVKIGDFCSKPHECPVMDECWKFLPENHVFELYRGNKQAMELFEKGILAIRDIPEDYELDNKQRIQHYCSKHNKIHTNKKGLSSFIEKLKYPLYFLDFETYQTAIPIYDDLSPYQQIPFQFSLHVVDEDNKKKHFSFIAESNKDPRKEFLKELKKVLGKKGSIIVYNQSFEQGRIEELAELFPKNKKWAESVTKRMVDLIIPFRNFDYYDCKQKGSCSIKSVLPALTDKTYKGMEIDNGGLASLRYLYIIHGDKHGKKASAEEVKKVREDLEKYCGLDTQAMIDILDVLKKECERV